MFSNKGESSQLDPQISGVKMTSVGKRDSLLARAEELKGRGSVPVAKPVSVSIKSVFKKKKAPELKNFNGGA